MIEERPPAAPRTFFRSVQQPQSTVEAFDPPGLLGRPPNPRSTTRQIRQFYEAVSVFDTIEAAARNAAENPGIGSYIFEVVVFGAGPIWFEQTGRNPHHFDLYGPFEAMLANSGRVVSRFDVEIE